MICGIDEAGRGPIIGPLVVCGVATDNQHVLKELSLRDSKQLSKRRREVLAVKIKEVTKYKIVVINAEEIDKLRMNMSLNEIEVRLYANVINELKPDIVYVDAVDVKEDRFKRDILNHVKKYAEIISAHKADTKYPIVSAASILAKVTRDCEIQKIEQKLSKKIGSGYPSDRVTIQFLRDWYAEHKSLPSCVRKSWKTVKRIVI